MVIRFIRAAIRKKYIPVDVFDLLSKLLRGLRVYILEKNSWRIFCLRLTSFVLANKYVGR